MASLLTGQTAAASLLFAAVAATQVPRASETLELADGVAFVVAYDQLSIGAGRTLHNLLDRGDMGQRFRALFNDQGFKSRVKGKVTFGAAALLGGQPVAAGTYGLTFRIDDALAWSLVVANDAGGDVVVAPLVPFAEQASEQTRLLIEPIAVGPGLGRLLIRFGSLGGQVGLDLVDLGSTGKPAHPAEARVVHALVLATGARLAVSHLQPAVGERAVGPLDFKASLDLDQPARLGDQALPAGEFALSLRTEQARWYLVAMDAQGRAVEVALARLPRPPQDQPALCLRPIATSDEQPKAALHLVCGSFAAIVPFDASVGDPTPPAAEPRDHKR